MADMPPPGQADPPFWCAIPPGFYRLPLDDEQADKQVREIAAAIAPSEDERDRFVALCQAMLQTLREENALYFGTALLRADDHVSMATLTIFTKALPLDNARLVASGAAYVLRTYPGEREVEVVQLPCGPAVKEVHMRSYEDLPLGAGATGGGPSTAAQVQYTIPFPEGKQMVVLDLSTTFLQDFDAYLDIAAGIAETVSFTDPEQLLAEARQSQSFAAALNPDRNTPRSAPSP